MKNKHMKTILLAGGSGFIGTHLQKLLNENDYKFHVLSRNPKKHEFYWNPSSREIDENALQDVEAIINLSGAGIADGRWTESRKRELEKSRTEPANFLFSLRDKMPLLKSYISASGITAYGFQNPDHSYKENEAFGNDFTSQLVKSWEQSAYQFADDVRVVCLRTAVVISKDSLAFQKMMKPVKLGIGSPIGSGKQWFQIVHTEDICRAYLHALENENVEGSYNVCADVVQNKKFIKTAAKALSKPFWFPNVPAFVLRMLFGEMADLLLKGVKTSNQKLLETGFNFRYKSSEEIIDASITKN